MFLERNSDAVTGLLTVTDNMLGEPLNPEIEALLKRYPSACTTKAFCIYNPNHRKYLSLLNYAALDCYSDIGYRLIPKDQKDQMIRTHVTEIKRIFPGLFE